MNARNRPQLTLAIELSAWLSDLSEQFWANVDASGDCWEYTGYVTKAGYGRCSVAPIGHIMAHRLSYELLVGPIPDGLFIDHLCRNRRCVNPDHLQVVTSQENTLRGATIPAAHSRKTHCVKGHLLDEANTIRTKRGARGCRECKKLRRRVHYDSVAERFWSKVEKIDGGCWKWRGARKTTGYGNFCPVRPTTVLAHRYAWELVKGPIPDSVRLTHTCGNTWCVNPDHLQPVVEVEAAA